MGTVIENHTCSREYPKQQEKRSPKRSSLKMCHPSQSSPNQNQAWQGVYPDLSAFNDLFSPAAPPPNPQSSPWISFLRSLGLQPIPQEQQQQQGSAQEQPSAPPATEQEPAGQTFAGSNVYSQQPQAGNQRSNTQSHSDAQDVTKVQTSQDARLNPAATPAPPLTSSTCSKLSPLASSSSPSSPAFLASSSIPPSTLCWLPLSWVSPCQPS